MGDYFLQLRFRGGVRLARRAPLLHVQSFREVSN